MRRRLFFIGGLALFVGMLAGACFGAAGDERFLGGSFDGYDLCTKTNTTIRSGLPSGTLFTIGCLPRYYIYPGFNTLAVIRR